MLVDTLRAHGVQWVCMAGFMRIITRVLIDAYAGGSDVRGAFDAFGRVAEAGAPTEEAVAALLFAAWAVAAAICRRKRCSRRRSASSSSMSNPDSKFSASAFFNRDPFISGFWHAYHTRVRSGYAYPQERRVHASLR